MESSSWKYHCEPQVKVGIVSGVTIHFTLNGPCTVLGRKAVGAQTVEMTPRGIVWNNEVYPELVFSPLADGASFSLSDVTIGVNFHWERKETQTFSGTLRLIQNGDKVCAVNELPVEKYLESVISSEMSATSSLELLKAHAVISRSWLLAQMEKRKGEQPTDEVKAQEKSAAAEMVEDEDRIVKWYDREDHTLFDVCADDHCQRYQGITKETSPHVAEAIRLTRGEILTSDGEICDARFSKCCGGVTEEFQYCWENSPKTYLKAVTDTAEMVKSQEDKSNNNNNNNNNSSDALVPDLTVEAAAERWIRSTPPAFCNTKDREVLSQVLNDYDQETTDFYRWTVEYTQEELAELTQRKTSRKLGRIRDLVPLQRGKSGRICLLKIIGENHDLIIGKELEIRRTLSNSHLYSSAFVVDKVGKDADGFPKSFTLHGAGWGHGVGLCQIGAAMMGAKGYDYDRILAHYYPGASLTKLYV